MEVCGKADLHGCSFQHRAGSGLTAWDKCIARTGSGQCPGEDGLDAGSGLGGLELGDRFHDPGGDLLGREGGVDPVEPGASPFGRSCFGVITHEFVVETADSVLEIEVGLVAVVDIRGPALAGSCRIKVEQDGQIRLWQLPFKQVEL